MSQLTYTGRVLKDGKLSVSPNAKRALSLRPGDELRITLRRKDEEISDEELPLESLDDAALRRVVRSRVSADVQQRMETLLIKNQDGTLTPAERREMLKINQDALRLRARMAQARLLLEERKA